MGSGRPLNSPAHISALYGHSRRNAYFARIGVFSGLGGNLQGGGLYLAYAGALYAVPTSIGFEQWRNSKGMGHRYSKVADYGTRVSEIRHPMPKQWSAGDHATARGPWRTEKERDKNQKFSETCTSSVPGAAIGTVVPLTGLPSTVREALPVRRASIT